MDMTTNCFQLSIFVTLVMIGASKGSRRERREVVDKAFSDALSS
jgi:hypothetical protein